MRDGVVNLLLTIALVWGWHTVLIRDQRTRLDFAHGIQDLVDVQYSEAVRIGLVLDPLNTRKPASLYAAFPPAEAKRLTDTLELHSNPKLGNWPNMSGTS